MLQNNFCYQTLYITNGHVEFTVINRTTKVALLNNFRTAHSSITCYYTPCQHYTCTQRFTSECFDDNYAGYA